ncbi:MAG: hypothetical protein H0T76_18475 [Nannocystis sp.]|nr:hypothetical protein [Nannocystis sp.]MBA3548472.1 hypothetical protein [Nannocystis sp.]
MASVLAALVAAVVPGCFVELPAACGDGHVDLANKETCDPAAPGPNNGDRCDPFTCRPVSEFGCGNGTLEAGEQCDTNDFGNKTCPSNKGFLSCTADCKLDESTCDPCGNRRLDPGEECDQKPGSFTVAKLCSDLTSYPDKPYSSGQVNWCTDQCVWYRGPCNYCGDEEVDDPLLVDVGLPDVKTKLEKCDGESIRSSDRQDYCDENCPLLDLLCTPRCDAKCQDFVEPISDADLRCCQPAGADCPQQDAPVPVPCCAGFAPGVTDPFDPLAVCELRFTTDDQGQPVQKNVCR